MQNKVLQNTLLILAGVAVGVLGFFLVTKAQIAAPLPASTSTGVTLTVPATVSITDDNNDIAATLNPGVIDSSKLNTITTASNNATGYSVTLAFKDANGVPAQACADNDNNQACDAGGTVFLTDNGVSGGTTGSYFSAHSAAPVSGSALSLLPGATFSPVSTNLGLTPITLYVTTGINNPASLVGFYKMLTDFASTTPGVYIGNLEYSIVPAA